MVASRRPTLTRNWNGPPLIPLRRMVSLALETIYSIPYHR